jgi:hypothetical protein
MEHALSDMMSCASPHVFSVHGLSGLSPKLARASNAASSLASNTSGAWFALSGALHPTTDTKSNRELFVKTLKLLRENQEQWQTDISTCHAELVLARNRIGGVARAGEFSEASGHKLAVSYYLDLECVLFPASIVALSTIKATPPQMPGVVSPQILGEILHVLAKVLAGFRSDDVIAKAPAAKTRRAAEKRRVGIETFERAQATLQARWQVGKEIRVLIEQEVIEAKAPATDPTTTITQQTPIAIDGVRLLLHGKPIDLDLTPQRTEDALDFIREVIRNPESWVSGPEIGKAVNKEGVRFDRVFKSLPGDIKTLIEATRRKGYRLRPLA